MSTALVSENVNTGIGPFRYNAALAAVAAALDVDEIREIENRAEAIRAYARQASNLELEVQAVEIRIRARRRLGQLLLTEAENDDKYRNKPMPGQKGVDAGFWRAAYSKLGVSYELAKISLRMASATDEQYENLISSWRHRCLATSRVSLTLEPPPPPAPSPPSSPPPEPTTFDTYTLENASAYDGPIGELSVSDIDSEIDELEQDAKDSAHRYRIDICLLKIIRNHFGGGVQPHPDGSAVLLEEIISEEKLKEFIAKAERDAAKRVRP